MRLDGRIAMVTGAGSGIGRATAQTLAREGAAVMCADLNLDGVEETARLIHDTGGRAATRALDVRDESAVEAALHATVDELGGLHVLVNDAGIGGRGAPWHELIAVNLSGVYYGLKHGCPVIEAHGGGAVVSLSSVLGLVGVPASEATGGGGYVASKHGVVGLTRSYALAYAKRGVRVNCVNPGYIETPMTAAIADDPDRREGITALHPMDRLGRAEEVASAILFLVSDDASFVTGTTLAVDGGYTAQ